MTTSVETTSPAAPTERKFSTFGVVWSGQFISLIGSELTAFALGLWAYRQTGSATQFTLIVAFANLPIVLLLPFAGALVDRWDRRRTMMLANAAAALAMLALAALALTGHMQIWHIYPVTALVSAANAFHWPAYAGLPALVVPERHLGRAAGMIELGRAGSQALAPMLAGVLVGSLTLVGVITVDMATFAVAIVMLMFVALPRPPQSQRKGYGPSALFADVKEGWKYIVDRPGLLRLLVFFAIFNIFFSAALVLLVPMVAAFSGNQQLGVIASIGTGGLVAGAILMSTWGGPPRKIYSLMGAVVLIGATAVLSSLTTWAPLVAFAMFGFYVGFAVLNASSQAIWQVKVPPELQGRIFALRRMVATITVPLAFFAAGPVADKFFEPLMKPGGAWARGIGRLIGTGHGRGAASLVLLLGLVVLGISVWGMLSPRLMAVEREVANATGAK